MISACSLFVMTIVLATSAVTAFVSPTIGIAHRDPSSSHITSCMRISTGLPACLDGIYYESASNDANVEDKAHVMCELGLLRGDEYNKLPSEYLVSILTNLFGLSSYDAHLTVEQVYKWGISTIEEFPYEKANYYYDQLAIRGIPCAIVPVEDYNGAV